MPDPRTLRDSTQIVLPCDLLADLRDEIESEFIVTIYEHAHGMCRIIGSPVEIRAVSDFLARRGIATP
ncbi:hypothetical protein ACH9L7_08365 [Haloferax sp. S1W]|uniref:VNG_1110C family protein n=1 Tax=Haloferax sp. S1W TaxID=3377110 RepID=UPI0037C6D3B6